MFVALVLSNFKNKKTNRKKQQKVKKIILYSSDEKSMEWNPRAWTQNKVLYLEEALKNTRRR